MRGEEERKGMMGRDGEWLVNEGMGGKKERKRKDEEWEGNEGMGGKRKEGRM